MLPTGNISGAESVCFSSLGSDLQQKQDPKGGRDYSSLLWAETASAEIPSAAGSSARDPKLCWQCSGVQETVAEGLPERTAPIFPVFCCTLIWFVNSLIWFSMCTLCCLSHDFRSQYSFWSNSDVQIHSSHPCTKEVPRVQHHWPNCHLE